MSFQVKNLTKENEIELFCSEYLKSFSDKKLKPLHSVPFKEALSYYLVRGVFFDERLIGGYIINHYPSRCLESLSRNKQNDIIAKLGGSDNTCELAAIWKKNGTPSKQFSGAWKKMQEDVLATKKKYIFGCCYKGNPMFDTYNVLKPKLVSIGKEDNDLNIFYFTRNQYLLTSILKQYNEFKRRILKMRITSHRNAN